MRRAGKKQRQQWGQEPCTVPRWDSWTNGIVSRVGVIGEAAGSGHFSLTLYGRQHFSHF